MPRPPSRERDGPLVVVVGPTASGKSRLALHVARLLDGEIISADSMQVYRGFDVGTDKVGPAERKEIPHHLLDICSPTERMDLARWIELAREAIEAILSRRRVPIVTGGTGLYVRGLLKGIFAGPSRDGRCRHALRSLAEREGPGTLHRFLARLDPGTAGRVSPSDLKRVVRGLEVIFRTGRPFSRLAVEWKREGDLFPSVKVGLRRDRAELNRRIDLRVERMYHHGLQDEVRGLLEAGVPADCNAFRAIGYREALQVVRGGWDVEEAKARTKRASRQYAKRQMTWFRKEAGLEWLDASLEPEELAADVARRHERLQRFPLTRKDHD